MPTIGFGTYLVKNEDASTLVEQALSVGYRHIDTAEVYSNETGETHISEIEIMKFGMSYHFY